MAKPTRLTQLGHGHPPGAEQGHVEDEREEDEARQVVLVDRGMFTPFGKRTTVGILGWRRCCISLA